MKAEDYVNQDNWPNDLMSAREFAREAILAWTWKKKAPERLAQVNRAKTIKRLQEIVAYAVLAGEGNSVIKY